LCPPDPDRGYLCDHTCDTWENTHQLTNWNVFVLVWNFITLGLAVMHYFCVWKRERFLIGFLDENDEFPEQYLPQMLPRYPEIDKDLRVMNIVMFISASTVLVFFIINVIVSGLLVLRDYYYGFQTATVFATNIGLITMVIEKALAHAWAGIHQKIALSCVQFEPVSYNVIDDDYRLDEDVDMKPPTDAEKARIKAELKDAPPIFALPTFNFGAAPEEQPSGSPPNPNSQDLARQDSLILGQGGHKDGPDVPNQVYP